MLHCQAIIFLTLWMKISSCSALQLPAAFERCKVSPELDGKPNECLANAFNGALPILSGGIKELGVLPLDPLNIIEMQIERGGSSPVAIKVNFTDCNLIGIKNAKVKEVGGKLSSPDGFHMIAKLTAPILTGIGSYEISGKVLILPIQGVGQSELTLYDADCEVHITGEKQIKKGEEYLKITGLKLSMNDPKRVQVHLSNLFQGDKALEDSTNLFLNKNWKVIYQELKGAVENAFSAVFKVYCKRILERIAFKDIFITE